MKIDYLDDIHIPEPGRWPAVGYGNCLHPTHGRLPDHLGLLSAGQYYFLAALWELKESLIIITERLDQENPDPAVPLRNIDEVYTTRGWILQSHRWSITPSAISDGEYTINPTEYLRFSDWRERLYRDVITTTLRIYCSWPNSIFDSKAVLYDDFSIPLKNNLR